MKGFASVRKFSWKKVPAYLIAQYLGAFLGAAVVYFNYSSAIETYDGGVRSAFGTNTSTGQIFTTFPNPSITLGGALLDQVSKNIILNLSDSVKSLQNINTQSLINF